jgi:transposase-like protein
LSVTRCVLTGGKSVDKAARDFGARSELERRWWGLLLRKCLDVLAKALGFANSAQRPRRVRRVVQDDSAPEASDPGLHADVGDLADARLRQGRSNGKA